MAASDERPVVGEVQELTPDGWRTAHLGYGVPVRDRRRAIVDREPTFARRINQDPLTLPAASNVALPAGSHSRPERSGPLCARPGCGHPADWHRIDGAASVSPVDPKAQFCCIGYDCAADGPIGSCAVECPNYQRESVIRPGLSKGGADRG